jgi:hypothetical protein
VLRRIRSIPQLGIIITSQLKQIVRGVKAHSQNPTARHNPADVDARGVKAYSQHLTDSANVDARGVKAYSQHPTACMIQLAQMQGVLRRIRSIPLLSIIQLTQIVRGVKAYSQHPTAWHNPADVDARGVKAHS